MSVRHAPCCRSPLSSKVVRAVLLSAGWMIGCVVWTATATAQLDANGLIGYAVTEFGPKYEDVEQAITRYKNRDFDGASDFLARAKQKNPELPPADVMLAKLHFAAKQVANGRSALERAVRDNPTDPEAFLVLAELSNAEGRLTAADMLYTRAGDNNKNLPDSQKRKRHNDLRVFGGLATIAERREDWSAAQKYLASWAAAEPDNGGVRERLGRALFMQGNFAMAEKAFVSARQKDASRHHPDVLMGRLYHQQGNQAEAQKHFDQAIAADGNNVTTRLAIAQWLLEQDQSDKANPHLAFVLKQEPSSREGLLLAGLASSMNKEFATAEDHLKKAHLLLPTNVDILAHLALAMADQKDDDKLAQAVGFAELGASQEPQNGNTGVALGWILYRLGQVPQAEQSLNAALKSGSLTADSRYLLAHVFFERGRNELALQLLEPALKTQGLFVHRREAQALLDKIKK